MTTPNLLNRPKLQEMADLADEIEGHGRCIQDALADYDSADDLSGEEATEARQEARDEAISELGDLLATAKRLAERFGSFLEEGGPDATQ